MDQPKLFCSKPFEWLEVGRDSVHLCCAAWLPLPVGSFPEQSFSEIWNSQKAQDVRRSILDGSFRHCTRHCPWLSKPDGTGSVQRVEDVTEPHLREAIDKQLEVLPFGPRRINCSFDRSCNLSCPSCRRSVLVETDAEAQILAIQAGLAADILGSQAEYLSITGSGDAFGSPYFRDWLLRMRADEMPAMKCIHLHTNGLLWRPEIWNKIDPGVRGLIRSAEVSIDAATADTYQLNRRGGRWDRLQESLAFISGLRREGPLRYLKIHMVVQANNFREMPAFVEIGKKLGVDMVYFSQLADWGAMSPIELSRRTVQRSFHPDHAEFRALLQHPGLQDPVVDLGNLREYAGQA